MSLSNIKNYTAKQKITNVVLLFVFFLSALAYYAVLPSVKKINNLKNEIIEKKLNTAKKNQDEKNAITLGNKISEIELGISSLEGVFINKNKELEFITVLENIAHKNNVSQKINLTPINSGSANNAKVTKPTEVGNSENSSPLSINIGGSYKDVMNYLLEISSLKYYINVEELDFMKNGASGTSGSGIRNNQTINLNIMAKIYWK